MDFINGITFNFCPPGSFETRLLSDSLAYMKKNRGNYVILLPCSQENAHSEKIDYHGKWTLGIKN